jgi:hypothetical protein
LHGSKPVTACAYENVVPLELNGQDIHFRFGWQKMDDLMNRKI